MNIQVLRHDDDPIEFEGTHGWVFLMGGLMVAITNKLLGGTPQEQLLLNSYVVTGLLLLSASGLYGILRRRDAAREKAGRMAAYRSEAMPAPARSVGPHTGMVDGANGR